MTVEAGITLGELQAYLAPFGQWIPLDPPHPERIPVERLLALNLSGPHRCGYGTVRDHVIGVRMATVDGYEIHSGGQVVKNVAGFDLHKLAIGACGSLGVVVEATFKLMPLPESTAWWSHACGDSRCLSERIESVWASKVQPVVFDVHRLDPEPRAPVDVVIGFAGAREDVAWQSAWAAGEGFKPDAREPYDERLGELTGLSEERRISVLPSEMAGRLAGIGAGAFVGRAANGLIRFRAATTDSQAAANGLEPKSTATAELARRVKSAFDPNGVLPPLP